MARITFAESADADAAGILNHLALKAGHRTAAKFDQLFERLYERLAMHPASGAPRPALGPDIRIGIVSPFIIIYRYTQHDDTVAVLRIVHGRRRISGQLLARSPA